MSKSKSQPNASTKTVIKVSIKPTDVSGRSNVCASCNTEMSAISNCILERHQFTYLCEVCAKKYTNTLNTMKKFRSDIGTHTTEISKNMPSAIQEHFFSSDRVWLNRPPYRKYRFRLMTPEEKLFFLGQDMLVFHLQDDGELIWRGLTVDDCPWVGPDSDGEVGEFECAESDARIHFNAAMYMEALGYDPNEAFDSAELDEGIYKKKLDSAELDELLLW